MKRLVTTIVLVMLTQTPASAEKLLIDFSLIPDRTYATNQYAGVGVLFAGGGFGKNCPDGSFCQGPPSPGRVLAVNGSATVNLDAGFITELQFYYTNPNSIAAQVDIFSEENLGGTLLTSAVLPGTPAGPSSAFTFPSTAYSIPFDGTARSVQLRGTSSFGPLYDDLKFRLVPEPGTIVLLGIGLVALARRRRANPARH